MLSLEEKFMADQFEERLTALEEDNFGVIDTERYIASITRDPINYTEWRRDMYDGLSVEELSAKAMEFHKEFHNE